MHRTEVDSVSAVVVDSVMQQYSRPERYPRAYRIGKTESGDSTLT